VHRARRLLLGPYFQMVAHKVGARC
jgi:hypothetical protein